MPDKKIAPKAVLQGDDINDCTCTRIGTYAVFVCQNCTPIPFTVTDRGRRDVGGMRQWDAIKDSVTESHRARQTLTRAAMDEGRKIERRVKRRQSRTP